ncbi:MAG: RagB/SusD family nutrient uptake outer membrane protein [Prolixibacteraceae bacterium]|nr:RagB/SusD family nutrient uptake outer membrane protein [Prolixibacteraceae bacterium]
MKRNKYIISLLFIIAVMMFGCEDYLNIPPEADISEEEVFGTYRSFQGFQDQLLRFVVDYNRHGARATNAYGGEAVSPGGQTIYKGNRGDYWYVVENRGIYPGAEGGFFTDGLYENFWPCIRMANVCLEKLDSEDIEIDATAEQLDWLRGQALFYRAFYYWEIVRAFGTLPYVDRVLDPADQPMKRHWSYEKGGKTYYDTQAVFERMVEDFQAAADLLPEVWPAQNINWMRPTKLAALGFKAKSLQYSASPLFNEQSTGVLDYDKELLDRCAAACQETIDLARKLVGTQPAGMPETNADGLTKWEDFRQEFATSDGTQPGTSEVLFHRPIDRYGHGVIKSSQARNFQIKQISKSQKAGCGSQNWMDKFEMKDGSRYKLEYDHDPDKRWENRDPRFDFTFYTHGDKVGSITLDLSEKRMIKDQTINSDAMRKYMNDGISYKNMAKAAYSTPFLRLADIYLTYAEAVFESTGSYNTIPGGLKMTAADAVNIVRSRAGMPDVETTLPNYEGNILPNSCELPDDPAFRLLYRNERHVELAYEGQHWFDLRRWKRAGLKNGKPIQALVFDVDSKKKVIENSVRRKTVVNYVFTDAHYWLPWKVSMTKFTTDWEQNPGW